MIETEIRNGIIKLRDNLKKSIAQTDVAIKQINIQKKQIKELEDIVKLYTDKVVEAIETIDEQNLYIKYLLKKIEERNGAIKNIASRNPN